MDYFDAFKPYSPKLRGPLVEYLRSHNSVSCDNHFYGIRYFYVMQRKGLIIPKVTYIRVATHPVPDTFYIVNEDFMLISSGRGKENMSCVGGNEGIHDPKKILKRRHWSIHGLDVSKIDLA